MMRSFRRNGWAVAAVAAFLVGHGQAQDKPKADPKKPSVMLRKLAHSQKLLEGLALGDFDKIKNGSDDLMLAAQEASWKVLKTPRYELYSNDFIRNLEGLQKAAKNKNLDAAALAYVEATLSCVKCHQYVREEKMGAAPDLTLPARLTAAR